MFRKKKIINSLLLCFFLFYTTVIGKISIQSIPKEKYKILKRETEKKYSITWKAPKKWLQKPLNKFRKGSFETTDGTDISIISFPGRAGSDLSNINRWRKQIGLENIKKESLKNIIETQQYPPFEFKIVTITNQSKAMCVAILEYKKETWFFKMVGTTENIIKNMPDFNSLIKSIKTNKQ